MKKYKESCCGLEERCKNYEECEECLSDEEIKMGE